MCTVIRNIHFLIAVSPLHMPSVAVTSNLITRLAPRYVHQIGQHRFVPVGCICDGLLGVHMNYSTKIRVFIDAPPHGVASVAVSKFTVTLVAPCHIQQIAKHRMIPLGCIWEGLLGVRVHNLAQIRRFYRCHTPTHGIGHSCQSNPYSSITARQPSDWATSIYAAGMYLRWIVRGPCEFLSSNSYFYRCHTPSFVTGRCSKFYHYTNRTEACPVVWKTSYSSSWMHRGWIVRGPCEYCGQKVIWKLSILSHTIRHRSRIQILPSVRSHRVTSYSSGNIDSYQSDAFVMDC